MSLGFCCSQRGRMRLPPRMSRHQIRHAPEVDEPLNASDGLSEIEPRRIVGTILNYLLDTCSRDELVSQRLLISSEEPFP